MTTEMIKVRIPANLKSGDTFDHDIGDGRTATITVPEDAKGGGELEICVSRTQGKVEKTEDKVKKTEDETSKDVKEEQVAEPAKKNTMYLSH